MLIKYNKYIRNKYKYSYDSYKLIDYIPCCDKFQESEITKIGFDYNKMKVICALEYSEEDRYENCLNYYHEEIKFCPFCGKKIEYNQIEEIDITNEYNDLCKQLEENKNMINATDSKSEELQLKNKRQDIINSINKLINNDFKGKEFNE